MQGKLISSDLTLFHCFLQRAKRAKYAQQLLLPLGVEDISTLRSRLVERAGSLEKAWKTEPYRMVFGIIAWLALILTRLGAFSLYWKKAVWFCLQSVSTKDKCVVCQVPWILYSFGEAWLLVRKDGKM